MANNAAHGAVLFYEIAKQDIYEVGHLKKALDGSTSLNDHAVFLTAHKDWEEETLEKPNSKWIRLY